MEILQSIVNRVVEAALEEDMPGGFDLTAALLFEPGDRARGAFIAKATGIVCGTGLIGAVYTALGGGVEVNALVADGASVEPGQVVARARGPVTTLLAAERTALNLICRLSGIATLTRAFVDRAAPHGARIADTRKTTPGLRALERMAVRAGGGMNHRFSLSETVMIKDNHARAAGGVAAALARARERRAHTTTIVCEVTTLAETREAIKGGADVVLLDNFQPRDVAKAVALSKGTGKGGGERPIFEASGGINLANVAEFAKAGAQVISVGALTHSAPALDLSFELED